MSWTVFGHSLKYWIRYMLILLILGFAFDRLQSILLAET